MIGGLIFLAALLLATSAKAVGATFDAAFLTFEAEAFSAHLDLGGEAIRRMQCHGASGDSAVAGLAEAGEWISFPLFLRDPVLARDSLCSAGSFGVRRAFCVEFREVASGRLVAADSLLTPPGSGLG